jgi:hypothetical protein
MEIIEDDPFGHHRFITLFAVHRVISAESITLNRLVRDIDRRYADGVRPQSQSLCRDCVVRQ